MNRVRLYYKSLAVGVAIGAVSSSLIFAHALSRSGECEPVVDVEYRRTGKKLIPETVVRKPVRDGDRCLLAEAGS
jgi:hypothetical protein